MSNAELNKCTKCNSRHSGNGEICGICADKLIADLLEACERVKNFLEVCHRPSIGRNHKIELLKAAIKKAGDL